MRFAALWLLVGCSGGEPNYAPQVTLVEPSLGGVYRRGSVLTVTARVDDTDDEAVQYRVVVDGRTHCVDIAPDVLFDCDVELPLDQATSTVGVLAQDTRGVVTDFGVAISYPNLVRPRVTLLQVEGAPVAGMPAELLVEVGSHSTDTRHLAVRVVSDVDGVLIDEAVPVEGLVVEMVSLSAGEHLLEASVTDPGGPVGERTLSVTVEP